MPLRTAEGIEGTDGIIGNADGVEGAVDGIQEPVEAVEGTALAPSYAGGACWTIGVKHLR